MKHTRILATLLLGLCCWALPAQAVADDTPSTVKTTKGKKKKSKKKSSEPAEEKAETEEAKLSVIGQLLQGAEYLTNARPNLKAKYFIFLHSASWCGPCRAVTPRLVAEYPNMMANKDVEVILLSCDSTPQKAIEYLSHYNAPFAAVMYGSPEAMALPGYPQDIHGVPHIVVVDAYGKMLYRGHGLRFADWKKHVDANK